MVVLSKEAAPDCSGGSALIIIGRLRAGEESPGTSRFLCELFSTRVLDANMKEESASRPSKKLASVISTFSAGVATSIQSSDSGYQKEA